MNTIKVFTLIKSIEDSKRKEIEVNPNDILRTRFQSSMEFNKEVHVFIFIRNQFIRKLGLDSRHFQYLKVSQFRFSTIYL